MIGNFGWKDEIIPHEKSHFPRVLELQICHVDQLIAGWFERDFYMSGASSITFFVCDYAFKKGGDPRLVN